MDLDGRQAGQLERVPDRVGVVRPRARVEDDPVGQVVEPVQMLDELALVVGEEEPGLQAEFGGRLGDLQLELGQGERSRSGSGRGGRAGRG